MGAFEPLLYVSPRSGASLWQEYRIYGDRVELQAWILFHTIIIPVNELVEVEVRPPVVFVDLFRRRGFGNALALKIDLADIRRHVAVRRKSGFLKCIRFTPGNPEDFVRVCKSIMLAARDGRII
ncbi:MAG: hypothetical protein ABSC01_06380 [Verrucomicrobiota bacterium]|jgi:hypothetical protein